MKWFKHLSGSSNNSIIFEAVERFGSEGYHVFFGVLEMMADEFDIHCPGYSCISLKKIQKNLQLSRQKIIKILMFFDQKAKTNIQKNVSFFATIYKTHVEFFCNRFADLCDNHTQKLLSQTTKQVRSKKEVTTAQEEEERRKKKDNIIINNNISHEIFDFANQITKTISDNHGNLAPKRTTAYLNKSADTIEKLIRIDGFEFDYIQKVISWAILDEFWGKNILSISSLRKKSKNDLTKFQNMANSYEQPKTNRPSRSDKNKKACADFIGENNG